MGYDSRIYVVEKSNFLPGIDEHGKSYAKILSMVEMCGHPAVRALFEKGKETDCYIYADDGNTQILEDKYGSPLKEASISEVIECLEKAESEEHYRRNLPLIGLLKAYDPKEWSGIAVLHYGH